MKHLLAGLVCFAFTATASVQAAATPEDLVHDTSERVMKVLKEERGKIESDPKFLYRLVDEVILPVIDFEAMAKLTLGKHWRSASADQRSSFIHEYRSMLVRTYTKSLVDYADSEITYLPARRQPEDKYVTVYTEVDRGQGKPKVPVNYNLRRVDDNWKVYDIVIDGLSLIKNYRTSFSDEIDQTSLQALIDRLAANNSQSNPE